MSTTTQDNDPIRRHVSIPISSSDDPNREGQTTNKDGDINNGDHVDRHKRRQSKHPSSNMYVKFDRKKRQEVLFWCQFSIFLLAVGICVASFVVTSLRTWQPRGIAMWQWSLLITVLLGGPLLSIGIVRFVTYFLNIDKEFANRENIIYYVVGLIENAWVVLWFSMILIAWLIVVDEPSYLGLPQEKNEKLIQKFAATYPIINVTLITLIVGSFLWLLKNLALMTAKSSFHIRRFFDRIREALMHEWVIETLINKDINNQKVVPKRIFGQEKKFFIESFLDDVNRGNVSCWGMKIMIDWIRQNKYLTYYDKANKNELKEIQFEDEAIRAADIIFHALVEGQDQNYSNNIISEEILEKANFPKDKVSEVNNCLLQGADFEQVDIRVFKHWMVKAFKYRSSLVRALEANKNLFGAFNRFINVLLIFFIFALWLIMLKSETRKVIFVIATGIVGSAVFFGDPCRKMFENLLFVFFVHPYDIGDCCLIDDNPVIIEKINVLTTTALTLDNEIRHYPNSNLAGQSISNYTRSPHMGDSIEFFLNTNTPIEKIDILKEDIARYINSQFWHPEHHWEMEFHDMSTMKMKLHFQHKINYHDFRDRQIRKSKLVLQIKESLNRLMLTTVKKE